jgi:hypothetical protein
VAAERKQHKGLWAFLSLVPLGLGTWAGFAYAGRQAGVRRWNAFAIAYLVCAAVGFALAGGADAESVASDIGASLLLIPWFVGIGHSFITRPEYLRRVHSGEPDRTAAARERLERRDQARQLVREDPRLAREMGIGRPDLDPVAAAGLIVVNSAPAAAISRLPGVDDALATEVVRVREDVDGFASLEELGMTLDLPAQIVEDVREYAVFLPR